jgi:hypothetical protein
LIRSRPGYTAATAIQDILLCYGKNMSVTMVIDAIVRDKKKEGTQIYGKWTKKWPFSDGCLSQKNGFFLVSFIIDDLYSIEIIFPARFSDWRLIAVLADVGKSEILGFLFVFFAFSDLCHSLKNVFFSLQLNRWGLYYIETLF